MSEDALTDAEQDEWENLVEKDPEELTDSEKTSKIRLSIKRRYDSPEWALAFEVASPDGRRADAIAVNTFPSRNFKIVGFEFKASRSDWLSEKREGAKADYFVTLCDEWYVVSWNDVVEESELPEGWGWMELKPNSEQLWSQVDSNLTDYQQGEPDRAFWGRFIQKVVGEDSNFSQQDLREARRRGYEKGYEEAEPEDRIEHHELERKAEKWDELQEAGLDWLYRVDEQRIKEISAARELLDKLDAETYGSIQDDFQDLIDALYTAESALNRLESAVDDNE